MFNPLSDFKANGAICFNLLSYLMSLYHENSCVIWILVINDIKPISLAATPSIFIGDVLKNCPECNQTSASLLFTHSGRFIHLDYHQPVNLILKGLRSCDVDVWCPLIAGMAWVMTSANSFTAEPTRRDRIWLQKFLWAQQWSAINKLAGFSTLTARPLI